MVLIVCSGRGISRSWEAESRLLWCDVVDIKTSVFSWCSGIHCCLWDLLLYSALRHWWVVYAVLCVCASECVSWSDCFTSINQSVNQSINQPTNQPINQSSRYSIEARATVRLSRIKEKCLKTDLKCVNGWSSSTVQWKRVPKSRSSNRETCYCWACYCDTNWEYYHIKVM